MTISIQKTGAGRAIITVDGRDHAARFDRTVRRWMVTMPNGTEAQSNGAKLKSCAKLFTIININGAPASSPRARTPRTPKAPATPKAPKMPRRGRRVPGHAFTQTAPTSDSLKLVALCAIEEFYYAKLAENGVTQDARDAFKTYEKVKALALGPTSSPEASREASSALRMATLNLIKLAY